MSKTGNKSKETMTAAIELALSHWLPHGYNAAFAMPFGRKLDTVDRRTIGRLPSQ